VTGVQTCALPICEDNCEKRKDKEGNNDIINEGRKNSLLSESYSQLEKDILFVPFDWSSDHLPPVLFHSSLVIACECLYANVPHVLLLNALLLVSGCSTCLDVLVDGDNKENVNYIFNRSKVKKLESSDSSTPPFILLVYEQRSNIVFSDFMENAQHFFDIQLLPREEMDVKYQYDDLFFIVMRLKLN
jgi:hypothetical protein